MKRPTLILFLAVWFASMAIAFIIGKSLQTEGPIQVTEAPPRLTGQRTDSSRSATDTRPSGRPAAEVAPELQQLVSGDRTDLSLEDALSQISSLSAEQSRNLLNEAFALPVSDPKRNPLLEALLTRLAVSSPEEALNLAAQMGSLRASERAKVAILEVWGKTDPSAALAWAQNALVNEPSNLRQSQITAILRGYAQTDPQAAFQYASMLSDETPAQGREKRRLLSEVLEIQIRNGGLNEARVAVETMSAGPIKDSALRKMVDEWASFDPESAAQYITAMGADASADLKRTLAEEWAENDPAAAAAWLGTLPEGDPAIGRATAEIIQQWARYDLNASAAWLNTLPASPELDRAVASYTFRAAQEDPQTAMTWAESISSDRMRTRMMERVAATWKGESPEEFEQFIQESDYSEEERETLRNARGGRGWGRW